MGALKKTNPRSYNSSSSTISGGNNRPEIIDEVLKLGGTNIFEVLEKYFIYGYDIKALLKKLDVLDAPSEVVDFLVTFGPFFDHIIVDFQRKHDAKTNMISKANERSKEWNLDTEADQHAKQLEEKLRMENEVIATLDAKIFGWKKEIKALQEKVGEAKGEKKSI